jgi:hypothetical protein
MRTRFQILRSLVAIAIVISASCAPKSDRTLILALIDRIGSLVEAKDASGLMSFIDEDYKDFENRDKMETEAMVREYFHEYRGIVLHILATRIDELKAGEASVQTEAVLSSGAAEVFRKLFRAFGDFYRFDLKFRKAGEEWRISYAKWENIGLNDLSPESRQLLKKIFPDI